MTIATSVGTRVSVVMPAYRAEATIRRALDSDLGQTQPASEIIVVDDGSPDGQASLVQAVYGDRVRIIRQATGGAASARNAGLDRASGDYIAFLDADDYWEPDKLARQLAVFARHREVGLVAGAFFEERPGRGRDDEPVRPGPPSWYGRPLRLRGAAAFRGATMIWTGTVLVRRDVLGSERFTSGLEPAEDRDLWVRLTSRCGLYLMLPPLATTVLVPGSLSRSRIDTDKVNMLRVVARNRTLLGPLWTLLWRSHTLYRWAVIDEDPLSALPRLLHSVLLWPLPYPYLPDTPPLGRLRRLAILLAALTRGGTIRGS